VNCGACFGGGINFLSGKMRQCHSVKKQFSESADSLPSAFYSAKVYV
jgi:hypothetical protein